MYKKTKPKYVPVDYGYVHSELKKVGVTISNGEGIPAAKPYYL